MKKKFTLTISTVVIIVLTIFLLIPAALPGDSNGTTSVTRMFGETIEGPWSDTPTEDTKLVLEITTTDGITIIVIQEVEFLWEEPEGVFVFRGKKASRASRVPGDIRLIPRGIDHRPNNKLQ